MICFISDWMLSFSRTSGAGVPTPSSMSNDGFSANERSQRIVKTYRAYEEMFGVPLRIKQGQY